MEFDSWWKRKKERMETLIGWRQDYYPYQLIEPRDHTIWSVLIFFGWFALILIARFAGKTELESTVAMFSALGVASWFHVRVRLSRALDQIDDLRSEAKDRR